MGLLTGEFQVAETLEGIRRDHRARYAFAADRLKGQRVLDVACGVGYGAHMLAEAGCHVVAADRNPDAIACAREFWWHERVTFLQRAVEDLDPDAVPDLDAITCFETLEHLQDPALALRAFKALSPVLYVSVPNEACYPYRKEIAFHFRHYTPEQLETLLNACGWEVQEWHGQYGPESDVEPNMMGRTLLAVCRATDSPAGGQWRQLGEVKRSTLESVCIVAMGGSSQPYLRLASALGDRHRVAEQIWAINAMGGVIQHDALFHMDDVKVQEARAAKDPGGNIAGMVGWLKTHPGPIYTSKAYPDYPGLVEFPLQEVVRSLGFAYFNSTVAYPIALAIHLGVKTISLYGCDFTYPNAHDAEKGRACVEFWMGWAAKCGISMKVPVETTLLDANVEDRLKFYGYDAEDIAVTNDESGRLVVTKTPRASLPTAEEIEARYDHRPQAVRDAEAAKAAPSNGAA